ncbi:MAG: hypothetical protein OEZ22_07240 [Spirochaetia bacterium]|nr:hypothetical protein [Spirochaetia bacterium]
MIEFIKKYKFFVLFAGWFLIFEGGMQFFSNMKNNPNFETAYAFLYGFMFFLGLGILIFYSKLNKQ